MEKKVLIVDDSNTNNFLLQSILDSEGIESNIALDGNEALDIIKRDMPSLILLDIMMPGIDGFKVLEEIKKNSETKDLPVIFITARYDEHLMQKALNAGATSLIQKPIDINKVIQIVKTVLN